MSVRRLTYITTGLVILLAGCYQLTSEEAPKRPMEGVSADCRDAGSGRSVQVSHYGVGDNFSGKRTANGERLNPNEFTAAHRSLPFGTTLSVCSLKTGRSVVVRINDRGPFIKGRELDVTHGAALALGIQKDGVSPVRIKVLG